MKRFCIRSSAVLLAFIFQITAFGQQTPDKPNADNEIRDLAERYFNAIERRDDKAIDELLVEECMVFYPRNVVETKAALLESLRKPNDAGKQTPSKHTVSDVKIRQVGDTVVLTAVVKTKRGDANEVSIRRTLTWARQDGRWRLLHDQWSLVGDAQEAEFWSYYFKGNNQNFNRKPNALLAKTIEGLPPGKALDAGVGEGRNAICLAKKGWNVTGFDRAEGALAVARHQATEQGVKIIPILQSSEEFDWGREQWDLVALLYFSAVRDNVAKIRESLKPGGLVVVEAFIVPSESPSKGVDYHPGQLRKLFEDGFKILRYEETEGIADYGQKPTKLVRLVCSKTTTPSSSDCQTPEQPASPSVDIKIKSRRSLRGR